MITRAQAEALLTLAESLEACERLDLGIYASIPREYLPDDQFNLLTAMELRLAVNALIPKQAS